jgi:hypothetical protein
VFYVGRAGNVPAFALGLLALASTVPFNCPRPESLRHKKGSRDHIVFLELYLGSVRGFSFSIYDDLYSLFRQKSRQRESSEIETDEQVKVVVFDSAVE